MQFELRTEFTPANTGWFTSSFVVYLNDAHNSAAAAAAAGGSEAGGSAAAAGSKLVDVDGSKAVLTSAGCSSTGGAHSDAAVGGAALQPNTQLGAKDGSSSSSSSSDGGVAQAFDEAVLHIAQLLPDRCGNDSIPAVPNHKNDSYTAVPRERCHRGPHSCGARHVLPVMGV
jgi:hypothetical protein